MIDSESASAAEVFARMIQIENRGKIFGDQSAGAVMTSGVIGLADVRNVAGYEPQKANSFYEISLTIGDLIMSDGNRLEGLGVLPDFPVGPTALTLSQRSDPVSARAAALFGTKITPEKAGKFQFLTEADEDNDDVKKNDDGGAR